MGDPFSGLFLTALFFAVCAKLLNAMFNFLLLAFIFFKRS
jgi:hypothetical protein